jgi:DNA-binding HxlR family transcriptional regulator
MSKNTKWTTDRAKEESEKTVLETLLKKSPQRWGELLKNTELSSRTLRNALERMLDAQLVYREVGQGKEYPPPVLYGLTPKGNENLKPLLFEQYSKFGVFNVIEEERKEDQTNSYSGHFTPCQKDEIKQLASVGKRLGILYLFAFFKSLEDQDSDWIPDAKSFLKYDFISQAGLGFGSTEYSGKSVELLENEGGKVVSFILDYGKQKPSLPDREQISRFKELLQQAFPDEVGFLSHLEDFAEFLKEFRKKPKLRKMRERTFKFYL